MKYRRYGLKSKKKFKFPLIISVLLILAFLIATLFSRILFKTDASMSSSAGDISSGSKNNLKIEASKFVLIQCGVYKSRENASIVQEQLKDYGNSFTVDAGENIKILLGLYSEKDGENLLNKLKEKNIDSTRFELQITKTDMCNNEIIAVIDANLQIINKLSDKNIKSIKTDDVKKWTGSLQDVEKNSKNYSLLTELKKYISNLPAEITRDNAADNYKFLYNLINEIK